MAPILLACPICKTRICSSAHSCPTCGEPLTDEWEKVGRTELKHRRIGWGFFLASVGLAIGMVVLSVKNNADQSVAKQNPPTPTVPVRKETSNNGKTVRALFFRTNESRPALFMDVKSKSLDLNGIRANVICPADGTGEIVAEVNGEYLAISMAARDRAFWVVLENQFVSTIDSGYPNNVPKRLEAIEPHMNTIIKAGVEMCPLSSPALESAFRALRSAEGLFRVNARRLGISEP